VPLAMPPRTPLASSVSPTYYATPNGCSGTAVSQVNKRQFGKLSLVGALCLVLVVFIYDLTSPLPADISIPAQLVVQPAAATVSRTIGTPGPAFGVQPHMARSVVSNQARSPLLPLKTVASPDTDVKGRSSGESLVTPEADISGTADSVDFPPPLTIFQRLRRSMHFYSRSLPVIWSYQVLKANLALNPKCKGISEEDCQAKWDATHESGSSAIAKVINELKGFYVKSGQLIATRVDLFPEQYTSKLSELQDNAEPMPFELVRAVVEQELLSGGSLWEVFESFDSEPLGSASVAQVHKATLIGGQVVAVKVQRPNIEPKMMGDIGNLKTISKQLRDQLPYDYYVIFSELETQLINEFDFLHEARSMNQVADHLGRDAWTNEQVKPHVRVPRPVSGLISKRAMVMDFVEGKTLTQLSEEAQAGIGPKISKSEQTLFARMLLKSLTAAFGRMIFETGFFHGDPHPGNIMVQKNGDVALIDWGQTKQISRRLKLNLARIITALANRPEKLTDKDYALFAKLVDEVGVKMLPSATNVTCAALAIWLFDSTPTLPGGYSTNELSENAPVRKVASFPQELVFVGRSTVLIRGIAAALGVEWSLSNEWAPTAAKVLQPRKGVALKATETVVRFRHVLATFGVAFLTLGQWILRKTFGGLPQRFQAPFQRTAASAILFYLAVGRKIKSLLRLDSTKKVATGAQLA